MSEQATVRFKEWDCVVRFERYAENGRKAIQLYHATDGDLVSTATVNMPEISLAPGEVIVRDYGFHKGMMQALVDAGVVEDTGKRVPLPHGNETSICRIV